MRISHVIPNSNISVIETFIKFVNENFSMNEHNFILVQNGKPMNSNVLDQVNVRTTSTLRIKDIFYVLKNNDKVIFHYLQLTTIQMFIVLLFPIFFKKAYWVAWGADLYQWRKKVDGNIFNKVKSIVKNRIALAFRRNFKYFVGIFPPDIDYFKNEFKSNIECFYASYTGNLYNPLYKNEIRYNNIEDKIANSECINIQIGHSSTNALNHIGVLRCLCKYKDENIRIYLPLNYGDMKYGDFVEEKAKKLFGDKAICIREMMSRENYMEYLSTIDIAIFNTTRQIGLGNISPMLYMEKKIYMPKDSVMYNFYRSQQVDIWDYNEIANFDYSEFIQPLKFKGGQKYIVENELDLEHKIDMWNKVFETPLKRGI